MTDMTFREVRELLDLVEQGDAAEVKLEWGDIRVHVVRKSAAAEMLPQQQVAIATPAEASIAAPAPDLVSDAVAKPAPAPAPAKEHAAPGEYEGCVAVRAPLAGIFYHAPAPDAPPFIEVGQKVGPSTEVCIIEVMKVMNIVKAGMAGTVVAVEAANEEAVQFQGALLWIRPE